MLGGNEDGSRHRAPCQTLRELIPYFARTRKPPVHRNGSSCRFAATRSKRLDNGKNIRRRPERSGRTSNNPIVPHWRLDGNWKASATTPRPSPPVPKEREHPSPPQTKRQRDHPHYSTPPAGWELEVVAASATAVTACAEERKHPSPPCTKRRQPHYSTPAAGWELEKGMANVSNGLRALGLFFPRRLAGGRVKAAERRPSVG